MQSSSSSFSPSKPEQSLVKKKPFKFKFAIASHIKRQDQKTILTSSDHHLINLKAMATLHRFKLLATQCGVAQSPTRSPRTSPVVHLRRRRSTLRSMLLGRRSAAPPPRHRDSVPVSAADRALQEKNAAAAGEEEEEGKGLVKRNSLKELFGSSASQSPPWEVEGGRGGRRSFVKEKSENREIGAGLASLRGGPGSPRPVWTGFRYRLLLRRAWRPVLVTIPE